jgi:serine/threonine-protein kinase
MTQRNTLVEGQIFEGRFEIISVLGQGGVGVVYKAKQTHMNKLVAIKTLMLSPSTDGESSFLRFRQESQAASSLNHQNIISIHDFGKTSGGLAYLVMEYLNGKTLDEVVETEKRLGPDKFLRLATQICDGLQHAHKKGIVHRDLKPSNIMLINTEDNVDVVKIVDFGLAKLTADETEKHLTKTGMIVGTPLYMSPEQCRGMELDHRTDIYSLGCVLYFALTGQEPIQGNTALDTLYRHTAQAPKSFKEACPDVELPARLEQAIMKALEKDPDDRQQSMMELRNDITDAIYYRSYHSGIQPPSALSPPADIAVAAPRPDNLSRTVDISHSSLAQPAQGMPTTPPATPTAKQLAATEVDIVDGPGKSVPDKVRPQVQTLRDGGPPSKDHVVISKSALSAGVVAAVVAVAGLAHWLDTQQTKATAPAPSQVPASGQPTAPPSGQQQTNTPNQIAVQPANSTTPNIKAGVLPSATAGSAAPPVVPQPASGTPPTKADKEAGVLQDAARQEKLEAQKQTALLEKENKLKAEAKLKQEAKLKEEAKLKAEAKLAQEAKRQAAEKQKEQELLKKEALARQSGKQNDNEHRGKNGPKGLQVASINPLANNPLSSDDVRKKHLGLVETAAKSEQLRTALEEANSQFGDHHWYIADQMYATCLRAQREIYKGNDPRIFTTLARMVGCEMHIDGPTNLEANLNAALTIFKSNMAACIPKVREARYPSGYWRPMAQACNRVAFAKKDTSYCKWSLAFYKLAISDWSKSRDGDDYQRLIDESDRANNQIKGFPGDSKGKSEKPVAKPAKAKAKAKPPDPHWRYWNR